MKDSPENPESLMTRTYRWDLWRGTSQGFLEACWQTFALLIAIRVFAAPDALKSLIPASLGIGMMLTLLSLALSSRLGWPAAKLSAFYYFTGAACLLLVSLANHIYLYVAGILAAQILFTQLGPLTTHIYATNYTRTQRGRRVANFILTGTFVGAIWAFLGGGLLDADTAFWRLLFLVAATAALFGGFCCLRMPSTPVNPNHAGNVWQNLSLAFRDRLFGLMLLAWMFMGFGNLMTQPLRIEYLANPAYGINANNLQIGLILGTIPLVARLFATKIWGFLFDRLNLVHVRLILNMVFFVSILLYFSSTNLLLLGLSTAILGIAFGGGGVLWTLWVTKLAPPEKVSAYMSVHTSFTGLRATLAPFLGYYLLANGDPLVVGWFAALLVGISTILFMPMRLAVEDRRHL